MEWLKRNYITILLWILVISSLACNVYLYKMQNTLITYIGAKLEPDIEYLQRAVSRNQRELIHQEYKIKDNASDIQQYNFELGRAKRDLDSRLDHQEYIETKRSYETDKWY